MSEGGDTNPIINEDDNPDMDDDDAEGIELKQLKPVDHSSRHPSVDAGQPSLTSTSHDSKYGETSFGGEGSFRIKESGMDKAWHIIHERFPKVDTSDPEFTATMGGKKGDRVMVRLTTDDGKPYVLFKLNGELRKGLPKSILGKLGPIAEKVVEANEEKITKATTKLTELRSALETADENQREDLNRRIAEQENEIVRLEGENEVIEQRMSLRDRIKAIFKKYGFTLIGVLAAVGTVIGVIVSNLKQGLTTLGKGVGSALKSIGKKLGEILPGLVGAIASFVFKTAGEVIGFLGKNAWLLIVGVVVFLIERLKKKTR